MAVSAKERKCLLKVGLTLIQEKFCETKIMENSDFFLLIDEVTANFFCQGILLLQDSVYAPF